MAAVIPTPVYSNGVERTYTGSQEDILNAGHSESLALAAATISLCFSLDRLPGDVALVSKDGAGAGEGDFTLWVKDGILLVTQSGGGETEYLKVPDLVLSPQTKYHVALSFGDEGLMIWLNGALVAAEPEFEQGMALNTHDFVVGGTRSWRSDQADDAHSLFQGTIDDVMVFDTQLSENDQLQLAAASAAELAMTAQMNAVMEDLAPVFDQLHGASDTFLDILDDYGVNHHGHFAGGLNMIGRNGGDNSLGGTGGADGINAGGGDDNISGKGGTDVLQGDYGNDTLSGGNGNDILDGGHGEDTLRGGRGNDLLISRADGREGAIYYDPDRDEGDPLNELTDGKLYPDQPIPADDLLIGGSGADIFYFQTLINAKQRFIEEHTRDDGSINWHGVAGENANLHDHWVDVLGHDVVQDFSRAEGDRLVIEGHTTEIGSITYGDADGDGVMDHSVISLYSDQGNNGGAHNDDRLGSITVYGDLVRRSDIEHTAAPAYGIVDSIDDLNEALAPRDDGTDTGPITVPNSILPDGNGFAVPGVRAPVHALPGEHVLTGQDGDYLNAGHSESLALAAATISLCFSLDRLPGDVALVSKDGAGAGEGDFTLWVKDGILLVTQSGGGETEYLKVPDLVLSPQTKYHVALSFGDEGLMIWLNGALVAAEPEFEQGMALNTHDFVVGGTRSWRSDQADDAHSLFQGTIDDVMVFDTQLSENDQLQLAAASAAELAMTAQMNAVMEDLAPVFDQLHGASDTFLDILDDYGVNHHGHFAGGLNMIGRNGGDNSLGGTGGADGINAGGGDDNISGKGGTDVLQGDYGNDTLSGGNGNDILDGGHGEDTLRGGRGNDLLISRADGREGAIYYDPDRDEGDPLNELTDGKLYPDQPIPADDLLIGGSGADIFYFQTLINAKQRFIEEHTRDDGSINWHGVAGENANLHDHWVDVLGHDVVQDFSRAEGDRLVIEGHTTEIGSITYGDADGDGVMDHSVISLYSDQGNNGGAHNDDRLGSITVYGDLVRRSDIEHTAAPAYGIVDSIDDLNEALAPRDDGTDTGPITVPNSILPYADDFGFVGGQSPMLGLAGNHDFSSEDRAALALDHTSNLALRNATIAFQFSVNSLSSYQALFSKDASGNGNGGHLSAYIDDSGKLIVRFQDASESYYFTASNAIQTGISYDFSLNFGSDGAELYLNGARIAYDRDVQVDWSQNTEAVIVGASGWSNTPGETDNIHSYFDGTISDFAIFDQQLSAQDILAGEPRDDYAYFDGSIDTFDFSRGSGGRVAVSGNGTVTELSSDVSFANFDGQSLRTADIQLGSQSSNELRGGDGADVLAGQGGNDRLIGMGNDDLLLGGLGADTLYGGDGRDTLMGHSGDDKLLGADGRDELRGGTGHDTLYGEEGNDWLYGGLGDDLYYGHTWNETGTSANDRAVFDGNFADYTFETETSFDSSRGENVIRLTVTDSADGGADGFYEGSDRLIDIDVLVFADQAVAFIDLL